MSWRRWVNRAVAPVSAVAGIVIVFSAVMFVDDDVAKIILIGSGMLVMQAGVWYMANPVLTSERHYVGLRNEVDKFISLVRELNQAAISGRPAEELDGLQAAMHASVDEMQRQIGCLESSPVDAKVTESAGESV